MKLQKMSGRSLEEDEMEVLPGTSEDTTAGCCHCRRPQGVTFRLILTIVGAVLGSFPFGYNLGSINAPESLIREFINTTQLRRDGLGFSEDALTSLWALTAAIFAGGGCLGAVGAGWWATKFGRRDGSLLASSYGLLAGILMMSCRDARSYELIILGRFIVGVQSGLFTGLTPMYLAEISPVSLRGAVGVLHQLSLVTGMLTAQVLGFPVLLGTECCWQYLLGLTAVPSLVQAMILPFCPESPRYLLTIRQDQAGCRKALQVLRGTDDVQEEIDMLTSEQEADSQRDTPMSIKQLLCEPALRQPLLLGVVLHLSQQLNGIPGVFFYSTRLFKDAGLTEQAAKYTTSGLGVVMVTMGILTVPLMDWVGRRTLMLLGLGGMATTGALVTVTLSLRAAVNGFNILSIIFIHIFVIFFALGPAPVPWLMVPELFTHDTRPAAVAICVFVNWMGDFLVGFGFPLLQVFIHDFVFLPFVGILIILFVFIYFKLPETKGKTFREINLLMAALNFENLKERLSEGAPGPTTGKTKEPRLDLENNFDPADKTRLVDTGSERGNKDSDYGSTSGAALFERVS